VSSVRRETDARFRMSLGASMNERVPYRRYMQAMALIEELEATVEKQAAVVEAVRLYFDAGPEGAPDDWEDAAALAIAALEE